MHPLDGVHDGGLADAVAVADLHVVGELGHRDFGGRAAEVEQQLHPLFRQRQAAIEGLLQEGQLLAVAEQRGADDLAVADHDRFEDPPLRLGEDDVLIGVALGFGQPHRCYLDAGDLELGGGTGTEVAACGLLPVITSASTTACSQSGATRP